MPADYADRYTEFIDNIAKYDFKDIIPIANEINKINANRIDSLKQAMIESTAVFAEKYEVSDIPYLLDKSRQILLASVTADENTDYSIHDHPVKLERDQPTIKPSAVTYTIYHTDHNGNPTTDSCVDIISYAHELLPFLDAVKNNGKKWTILLDNISKIRVNPSRKIIKKRNIYSFISDNF